MSSRAARDARTGRSPPYVIRAVTGCVLHATNQVSGLLSGRQRFLSPRFCSFRRLSLWSRHRNHGGVVCFCGVRRTLLSARGCTSRTGRYIRSAFHFSKTRRTYLLRRLSTHSGSQSRLRTISFTKQSPFQ